MGISVYKGFWINWEDGRVAGATLTLPTYQGLILGSFLTLFVQFSGACFWRVLCFILHQFRSTTEPRDGFFHQQQAILRNAITAPNALWSLNRSAFAWRGKVRAPFRHSLPLVLTTLVHIAFFGAAALLSSQISSTGAGQALVRNSACGFPKELPNVRAIDTTKLSEQDLITFNAEILLGRLTLTKSAAYVRSCYNDDTNTGLTDCNVFVQSHLEGVDASAVRNASCPFGSGACATAAVRYDSGHVHSNKDVGINFPSSEGVTVRRVTTCAPIIGEKYATGWRANLTEGFGGKTKTSVKFYEFGKDGWGCDATNETTGNTTFCVSQYMKENWQDAYTVYSSTSYFGNSTASDFTPIPDFAVPNADTTLIAVFSRLKYTGKSADPMFNIQNISTQFPDFFTPTNDLSILGCTEQYQFCVENNKCTDLTGLYGIQQAVDGGSLTMTRRQQATFTVMWKAAWSMALQWACKILDDRVLLAQDWIFTSKSEFSSTLPDNQWELESFNLHNLSLAVFQRRINEYASPINLDIRPGVNSLEQMDTPTDPYLLDICKQQRIFSTEHISMNVLGISVILGVGSLLILLDWVFIEQIFWFRSFTHHRLAKKADWMSNGTLQLHRRVLETRATGPWVSGDYQFPVLAEKGKVFSGLGAEHEGLNRSHTDTTYSGSKYSPLANETGAYQDIHFHDPKTHG